MRLGVVRALDATASNRPHAVASMIDALGTVLVFLDELEESGADLATRYRLAMGLISDMRQETERFAQRAGDLLEQFADEDSSR